MSEITCHGSILLINTVRAFYSFQAFTDIVVRDSELVTVELVASDRNGDLQGVIFLGSIKYDALKRVYDSRVRIFIILTLKASKIASGNVIC